MAKREKKPVLEPKSSEQAEAVMAEYATADAKIAEINAQMDQRITKIREEYADQLQELTDTRDEKFLQLQLFAETNKLLFEKKKSIDMAHGVIGFRTGTPKLKLLKGFTWAAVINLLKDKLPTYVRTIEEPAKDKLLADREIPEVFSIFPKVGIQVGQDETFYVDLKKEEIPQ